MTNDHNHNDGKFFFGLFLGGLVGALTVFFMGTPEGKKAGKALRKKGQEFLTDLEDRVDDLQDRGRELLAQSEEIRDQIRVQLKDKKDELTDEAMTRIDKALESVESLQQKGLMTTENLRKQFKNAPKKSSPTPTAE